MDWNGIRASLIAKKRPRIEWSSGHPPGLKGIGGRAFYRRILLRMFPDTDKRKAFRRRMTI